MGAAHCHRQASFFLLSPKHRAALEKLKAMNIFNIQIFMTKNLKRKESQEVSPQKLILELM